MSITDELLELASQDTDAEEALTEQLTSKYETLGTKVVKWYEGAKAGYEEIGRANVIAQNNAPQVIKDRYDIESTEFSEDDVRSPIDYTGAEEGKATTYTPKEQEVKDYLDRASSNFAEETIRPVATIGATFGGSFGMALLAPFMMQDIGKAVDDEDYVGAAKTMAMLSSPALAAAGGKVASANALVGAGLVVDMAIGTGQQLTDSNFQQYANYDPIGAIGNMGANIVPLLHPAMEGGKMARKGYLMTKEKLTQAQAEAKLAKEFTPMPQEVLNYSEGTLAEKPVTVPKEPKREPFKPKEAKTTHEEIDMGSNKEVQDTVKGIEDRIRENDSWNKANEVLMNGENTPYTTRNQNNEVVIIEPAPIPERGWLSRLWRGNENETVKVRDIHNVFNSITRLTYGQTGNPNVLGWYHTIGQGIRVQKHQFFETIAHEVGHHVDRELMRLGGFDEELVGNAKRRWNQGQYGDPTNPANDPAYRREGIADFTVCWMLNKEQARQIYPNYFEAFERALNLPQNRELKQKMEMGSELIRRWYQQTPEQRGVGSMIQGNEGATIEKNGIKGVLQEIGDTIADNSSWLRTNISDHATPLRDSIKMFEAKSGIKLDLTENPADLVHHALKQIPARISLFLGENKGISSADAIEVLSNVYNVALRRVTMRDIYDTMEGLRRQPHIIEYCRQNRIKDVHTAVSNYLTSLHALEIIAERGNDYNTTKTIADHRATVNNAPAEFAEIAMQVSDYNHNMLSLAVRFGLIDQGTMDTFRRLYPHYVPFKRSFAEEGIRPQGNQGRREGFANLDNMFHRLSEQGSDRDVLDPLIQMQLQTATIITKGQKNMVARQVASLSTMRGGDQLVMDAGDTQASAARGQIEVFENGHRRVYNVNPAIYDVLVSPETSGLAKDLLSGYLRWSSDTLRKGTTQTIPFTIWNAIRDSFTAAVTTKTVPLREFYKANPMYFFFNGMFKQIMGGDNALTRALDNHGLMQETRAYSRDVRAKYEASGVKWATRYQGADALGQKRRSETLINDSSSAYAKFRKSKQFAKSAYEFLGDVLTMGKAGEYVENAPRFTEFERTLKQGGSLMQAADNANNVTVDFGRHGSMKAVTQYTAFFNAALQGNIKVFRDLTQRPGTVIPFALMNITLPSMILWAYNKDKDWYKSMTIDEKMKNWHIERPDGTIMRIPKPELLGYLAGSMPERLLDYHVMGDTQNNLNKAGGFLQETLLPNATPTGLIPIYEWWANKKFYGGRKVVEDRLLKLEEKDQYNVYTSELAKKLGGAIYDSSLPQSLASPAHIDNAIRDIGGSTASFFLGVYDDISGEHKAPARKDTEKLRFYYTPGTMATRETQDFFDLYKAETKKKNSNSKRKSNTLIKLERPYQLIKNLNSNYRKMYLEPTGSKYHLSDVEKRKAKDEKDAKVNALAKKALATVGRDYFK